MLTAHLGQNYTMSISPFFSFIVENLYGDLGENSTYTKYAKQNVFSKKARERVWMVIVPCAIGGSG